MVFLFLFSALIVCVVFSRTRYAGISLALPINLQRFFVFGSLGPSLSSRQSVTTEITRSIRLRVLELGIRTDTG